LVLSRFIPSKLVSEDNPFDLKALDRLNQLQETPDEHSLVPRASYLSNWAHGTSGVHIIGRRPNDAWTHLQNFIGSLPWTANDDLVAPALSEVEVRF
jgi:hypothetical protein